MTAGQPNLLHERPVYKIPVFFPFQGPGKKSIIPGIFQEQCELV